MVAVTTRSNFRVPARTDLRGGSLKIGLRLPLTVTSDRHHSVVVSREQAYFWSAAWQREERQADLDMMAGRVRSFSSVDDALAWLSSDDG